VEAALQQPFEEGLALELKTFVELLHSPESRALQHAFRAERAAARVEGLATSAPVREVQQVGVVGSGTMGTGITICCLDAGLQVTLLDQRQDAVDRALTSIRQHYEAQVAKGRLDPRQVASRLERLTLSTSIGDLAPVDLAIEAVFEDMAAKRSVFEQLDAVLRPGAILASNTSTLDLDALARITQRPQDVVGLHFFSPAHVMRLLEVVRGARTSGDVLAAALALGKRLRKTCVVCGVCDGFIGNRMLGEYLRQAGFLLDEGCSPQQVDRAVERFGMAMGPFRMSDMAGNDIGWAIRKRHAVERPRLRYSASADRLCEMGRLGQKSGAGWYDYAPGQRTPQPSPAVEDMLVAHRARLGITPRRVSEVEIVQRLIYALVNEGARILEEGIAARAGDIDVVYLHGYGFPAWRGGPMYYAQQVGLADVVAAMQRFARNPLDDAGFWQPAALLQHLALSGQGFSR
jgi:3-hydroxyacyl-CoA dehydrogenase